jgi:hypothetical protein
MQCTSDACNQGRKPCPTPDACELAEQQHSKWSPLLNVVLIVVGFGLFASLMWFMNQVGALFRGWLN